ncbi:hypothetical protein, partial [Klebsiella pneumoniae]|uniref:hypothetical protein n=1 Tax=Klebsiella pneumoniae TaxID=573 RepID=UPI001F4B9C4B
KKKIKHKLKRYTKKTQFSEQFKDKKKKSLKNTKDNFIENKNPRRNRSRQQQHSSATGTEKEQRVPRKNAEKWPPEVRTVCIVRQGNELTVCSMDFHTVSSILVFYAHSKHT